MILDPDQADGRVRGLDDRGTTMWYPAHQGKCGANPLLQPTLLAYCYECGVYWLTERALERALKGRKDKGPWWGLRPKERRLFRSLPYDPDRRKVDAELSSTTTRES